MSAWRPKRQGCGQPQRRRHGRAQADRREDFDHAGHMDFVDNVIDGSPARSAAARYSQPNGVFTPGMFARVQVPGSPPYRRCLSRMPRSAASRRANTSLSSARRYGRAEIRDARPATADNLRVIKGGLGPDDRVVVNGLMRARPGRRWRRRSRAPRCAAPGRRAARQK